jgi:hypothetical protein
MTSRPLPSQQIITELCYGTQRWKSFIANVQHGLHEVSLAELYPQLDLDEVVAFAEGSWELRKGGSQGMGAGAARQVVGASFRRYAESAPLYDIFRMVYRHAFPKLKTNMQVSSEMQEKHAQLNPFQGKDLETRLVSADPGAVQRLREQLSMPVRGYIFEIDHDRMKQQRTYHRNLGMEPVVMTFQTKYPDPEQLVPRYAAEIGRMLRRYPRDYASLQQPKPAPEQLSLLEGPRGDEIPSCCLQVVQRR